jgi:transposase
MRVVYPAGDRLYRRGEPAQLHCRHAANHVAAGVEPACRRQQEGAAAAAGRARESEGGRQAVLEDRPPGTKPQELVVERRMRLENEQLKLALAEATVQLRIWRKGAEHIPQVPSSTSKP